MITHAILVLLMIVLPAVTLGQGLNTAGPRATERIEQLKKVRMIEALDLTEDQSIRFFARLHEHEKEKQSLIDARSAVLDKLERLVRNNADGDEYLGLFSSFQEADSEVQRVESRFFGELAGLLSESQRAKYLLFSRQFHRELQDALQFMHRRRQGL